MQVIISYLKFISAKLQKLNKTQIWYREFNQYALKAKWLKILQHPTNFNLKK